MRICGPATKVFTCKLCAIFFVYTVIFQHLFKSSITRPMKSIFELRSFIAFSLGRTEVVRQRCCKTLFKKYSGKDVFLWNTFFTYSHIFFVISNITFASACFLQYYLFYYFLENDAIYFLSNVSLLKIANLWMTFNFCLQLYVA